MPLMLIRPLTPASSSSGIVSVQYPINIGYLAAYLKRHGVLTTVRDYEVEPFEEGEFLESVRSSRVSLVGFSCMTPHIRHAAFLAGLVKKHFPDVLTVVGGVHATAIPEQTLEEFPQFDVVVRGEGEQTLLDLYRSIEGSHPLATVKGIAFRAGGETRLTPPREPMEDLDLLPFPARDLIPLERYRTSHVSRGFSRKAMNIAEIMTSRGCPYDCIFCASKVVHPRRVRFRSAENIIAEMEALVREQNVTHFSFLDDTFTIKREVLYPVCDFMGKRGLTFDCFTRVNDVDEEKMGRMVASGCRKISFGIESGSPRVLKLLKKGITVEHVENAFRIARRARLPVIEATFLLGSHPDESREDIELTKRLIFRLRPDIMALFIAVPYPGTELNRILKERGLLEKENWEEFTLYFNNPSWRLGAIAMDELHRIQRAIYRSYYLNPLFLAGSLLRVRSLRELKYFVDTGISFFKTLIGR